MKISELALVTRAIETLANIDGLASNIQDDNCVLNVGKAALPLPADVVRAFVAAHRRTVVQQLAALNVYEDPMASNDPAPANP